MNRANARASEHGIGGFGDHRQIDGDTVAFLHAVLFQHIGKAADLVMQLLVGDFLVVIGIITFPDDGGLVRSLFQMPIDAVIRDVEHAIFEPFD